MITAVQCKEYLTRCQKLGTEPNISMERTRSIMSVCGALIMLAQHVDSYHALVKDEGK